MQNLTSLLHRITKQITFEVSRHGTYTRAQLMEKHHDGAEFSQFIVRSARPQVPEGSLTELTESLRLLLGDYIDDDHIGNGFVSVTGGSAAWKMEELAQVVTKAAAIGGVERVTKMLDAWARGAPIRYRRCFILSGLSIDEPLNMGDGVHLIKMPTSSNELVRHLPDSIGLSHGYDFLMGSTKMIIECQYAPAFYALRDHPLDSKHTWARGPVPDNLVGLLCKALSLACNCSVDWEFAWDDAGDAKVFGMGVSSYSFRNLHLPRGPQLSQESLDRAKTILDKFLAGHGDDKRLNMAIDRWRNSKSRPGHADKFIELRIALESLYLPESGTELGYRLSSRGAWHLGTDFDERLRYRTVLRKAYDLASQAVHTGDVVATPANNDLLTEAQDLCRLGILKKLDQDQEPNWDELTLGKQL